MKFVINVSIKNIVNPFLNGFDIIISSQLPLIVLIQEHQWKIMHAGGNLEGKLSRHKLKIL